MKQPKLWTKNFSLIVIGQIISLFGNNILRFALSMVILDMTGSVTIFATYLAISMIPTVLLSLFGGILADRVNRRNIMVGLDFLTSIFIFVFALIFHTYTFTMWIGVLLVLLSIIQSFYQPAVQSSIPIVVDQKYLMPANGIVIEVNALASLIGPILGGILYGFYGLYPILWVSTACFFFSAILEIFIKLPKTKIEKGKNIFKTITTDFKSAFSFLIKKQKNLFYLLLIVALLNFSLSSMLLVGLPFIIKILLGFSNQSYGYIEAAMGVGSILGGIFSGIVAKKLSFKKSYLFLFFSSIAIIPIAIATMNLGNVNLSYFLVLISVILSMLCATLFTVFAQTFMQKLTPNAMLGKVASVVTILSMCAMPLGQATYGLLFGNIKETYIILFISIIVCIILTFFSKKIIGNLSLSLEETE